MNAEGLAVEPAAKLGLTWGEIKAGTIKYQITNSNYGW